MLTRVQLHFGICVFALIPLYQVLARLYGIMICAADIVCTAVNLTSSAELDGDVPWRHSCVHLLSLILMIAVDK